MERNKKWGIVRATGGVTFIEKDNERFALRFDDGEAYRLVEKLNHLEAVASTKQPADEQVPALSMSMFANRADYDAAVAQQAPAITEQAPPLPEPDFMSGDCTVGESAYTEEQMRERDAMWMAKIAAIRSEQVPAGEVPRKKLRVTFCEKEG